MSFTRSTFAKTKLFMPKMYRIVSSLLIFLFIANYSFSQQTTGEIVGNIFSGGKPVSGASVLAVHVPSGSKYTTVSNNKGLYRIPNMRVGGPYTITVTNVGFKPQTAEGIYVSLANATNTDFDLQSNVSNLQEVVVTSQGRSGLINNKRTGAASNFNNDAIVRTPTIGRTITDVTKYNPYSNGQSFGGLDPRLNNFTIDGSVFNNGFGLGSSAIAGGRTGSSAISLDAIEQLQVNVAPFDVRQSGFAGADINAVTKSGTNEFSGSVYKFTTNQGMVGEKAAGTYLAKYDFGTKTWGFRLGGPIIKNKLFFFVNGEFVDSKTPALSWQANRSGVTGNVSRTSYDSLAELKSFMMTNFGWDMGAIDNFSQTTNSKKYLARIDYNINDNHKLTLRYSHHDSKSYQLISNSSSGNTAGNGNRTNSANAISGQNTGYNIQDNTRSFVAELNSSFKGRFSNKLIGTYNKQIEDRAYLTDVFPTIDILASGGVGSSTYTGVGFDPFTPDNKLNYSTTNITDNFTMYKGNHTITVGASFEHFVSNNLFFYASNGVWVFNSIKDFETAALAYKANPNLTTSPVAIARFNYRYTLLPNGQKPWQQLKVNTISWYAQDEYQVKRNFKATAGIRFDYINVPTGAASQYFNPVVDSFTFNKPDGTTMKINTSQMPSSRVYISPRAGFNWDVFSNKTLQVRGGTGIFLSRVPYVLISNQLGNNGVNIGLVNVTGSAAANYPFTTNPSRYTPTSTNLSAITGYNLNVNDPSLKFPSVWKTDLAVDYKIPKTDGIIASLEFVYSKNINALYYYDANLKNSSAAFSGADNRPFYPALGLSGAAATNARFINPRINNAYVLSNKNEGYGRTLTMKLEKTVTKTWGGMVAYTLGRAKDLSFVASTVNANVPAVGGVNYLVRGYSDNNLAARFVAAGSYRFLFKGKKVDRATTISAGFNALPQFGNNISYVYSGDMNGDGLNGNDLIYVPKQASDLQFDPLTVGTVTYTAVQQQAAFDTYISNNKYLSKRKGSYAERNGGAYPWLTRMDISVQEDFIFKTGKQKHTIQLRADIFNFGNMLNSSWGLSKQLTGSTSSSVSNPLVYVRKDATTNQPVYRLATQVDPANGQTILLRDNFITSKTLNDVFQIQFGIRYIFN